MRIFEIASSDGLLNRLMYGFDPKQGPSDRNAAAWAAMIEAEREIASALRVLNRSEALSLLNQKLGKPQLNSPGMTGWMLDAKGTNTLAITEQAGKTLLVWMLRGQVWSAELAGP